MGKIVEIGAAVVIVIMMVVYFVIPIVGEAMTDTTSENFATGTGAAETSETVTLAEAHYYDDYDDMTVSSDNGSDTPAILSYTASTKQVVVGGLVQSGSRVLAVGYTVESEYMDTYMGLRQVFWVLPVLIVFMVLYGLFKGFTGSR